MGEIPVKQWWKPQVPVAYMKAFMAFHALHYSRVERKKKVAFHWKCINYLTLVCLKVIFYYGMQVKNHSWKTDHRMWGRLTGSFLLFCVKLSWTETYAPWGLRDWKDWSCCHLNLEVPSTKVQNGLSQANSFPVQ